MNKHSRQEQHGLMTWTGRFDEDGRAIFECSICGDAIALSGLAEPPYKRIRHGNVYAGHSAYITLGIVKTAYELEIWPQAANSREMIDAWEQAGGGSPFTISGTSIQRAE